MCALLPLTTLATALMQRSCLLCMLLRRCGAGVGWGLSTPSIQRRAALREVRMSAQPLQGQAVLLPSWQVLSGLLQCNASKREASAKAATREAALRHSAVHAAVQAEEAGSCSSRRSVAASRLPTGGHSSSIYSCSCRAAAPANISTRADTQHSFAAHSLRADDDQV